MAMPTNENSGASVVLSPVVASAASVSPLTVEKSNIPDVVASLRRSFGAGRSKPLEFRKAQLLILRDLVLHNKEALTLAVMKDLGKRHPFEVTSSEINFVLREIEEMLAHVEEWVYPEKVYSPIGYQPATSWVYHDPKGVVLIMSPWNYPINLALVPLAGAIAGGNCALLKLSRHSANTASVLGPMLQRALDPACFAFEYAGGADMITALIKEKWDHIFFTGSVAVGRIVYQAAAAHLTPVTLELGGKNPCILDKETDIEVAARRVAFGKFFNAGQTCVGVDYLLAVDGIEVPFLEAFRRIIQQFYGEDPRKSECFARIISEQHTKRLAEVMKDGKVVIGGDFDVKEKYVAPTVLLDVSPDSVAMTDEIFGPVLPIIRVRSVDEAIDFINQRPCPLSLYVFTNNSNTAEKVIQNTRSGSCDVNEVILHFINTALPFGGVMESGLGSYHGRRTFDVFTHERAVIKGTARRWLDMPLRYPPYGTTQSYIVEQVLKSGW